jgi:hypothetical protein
MRTVVPGEHLIGQAFCDVTLTAIIWKEEGVDLNIELLDSQLVGSTSACFVCRWFRWIAITLDLSKNPGPPLTWEGEVARNSAGGFRLALQFGSAGTVTLDCEHLELRGRD